MRTERVAECDGCAEWIDLAGVELEVAITMSFVELDPVQLILGDTGLPDGLWDPDAHDFRSHAGNGDADETVGRGEQ